MSSLILGEHRGYLADVARLAAYRAALQQVIRPGDVVLDLGSGTGVLGVLACEAGAGRVYAVDTTSMVAVTRAVAAANDLSDRITVLRAHSLRVELPERVDVVVADQLGPLGVEAGMLEAYADARRRHLKPGGILVPRRLDLVAAPVSSDDLWDEISFWDRPIDGIDVTALRSIARNVRYYGTSSADDLLGAPVVVGSVDPGDPAVANVRGVAELPIARAGTLHGIACWFSAELAEGISISNSPADPDRLQRKHAVLPVTDPIAVEAGDTVELELEVAWPEQARWQVAVRTAGGEVRARSRHSTAEGTPLAREDLARTRPDHVPSLSPKGRARADALTLIDGEHTVADIEAQVWERHQDAFPSSSAAAAFVTELVARETD